MVVEVIFYFYDFSPPYFKGVIYNHSNKIEQKTSKEKNVH